MQMSLYKFNKLADALGIITGKTYQLITYTDGSGLFEIKNTDEVLFYFHDEDERDKKLLAKLKEAIGNHPIKE